ncbi:hypothetical protein [Paenibacillus silvae]|uniref:Uncharacterized protein n=1 Tax=Paenibacillus silvae TaxID=1325358 RepID=A0A2W6PGW8_9BACL|nr:hypothetical protein [Paenibacillus silvae]PZT57416.1 hypothetical protein DN757_01810 [Paenibacillus silvae]
MTEPVIDQLAIISYKDGHWKYAYVTEIYKQGYVLRMENGGKTLREYILDDSIENSENNKLTVEVLLLTDKENSPALIKRTWLGKRTFKGLT